MQMPLLWQQWHFKKADILALKTLKLENDFCDPQILFHKIIYYSILNYFNNLKKILLSQSKIIRNNHTWLNRIFLKLLK
jgi:hypothetical protein